MKGWPFVLAFLLWLAWAAAILNADFPGMALVLGASVIVRVAQHDWALGRRPFDKINPQ